MRGTKSSVTLAILLAISSVGCKSMPSLTWWKTASKNEAADSTAVARSAPELPSEVALQKEGAAMSTSPTSTAAPYVSTGAPAVNPSAYPTTSAPPFNPSGSPAQVASTAAPAAAPSTTTASSPNPGSVAMPYNPSAVPPATQSVAAAAEPQRPASRYGSVPGLETAPPATTTGSSAPAYPSTGSIAAAPVNPVTDSSSLSTTTPNTSLGNRYGNVSPGNSAPAYSTTSSTSAPSAPQSFAVGTIPAGEAQTSVAAAPATSTGAADLGGRYAQNSTPGHPVVNNASMTSEHPTTSPAAPAISQTAATSEPYRPGGTSSYPSAMQTPPKYQVASRPEDSGSASKESSSVPNVATPGDNAPPAQRYW